MTHYQRIDQDVGPSGTNDIKDPETPMNGNLTFDSSRVSYHSTPGAVQHGGTAQVPNFMSQSKDGRGFYGNLDDLSMSLAHPIGNGIGNESNSMSHPSSSRISVARTDSNQSQAQSSGLSRQLNTPAFENQGIPHPSSTCTLVTKVAKPAGTRIDGYPQFADGDVLIVSPTGKRWRLHSLILSQSSTVLRELLIDTQPVEITPKMRREGKTIKWKLEMVHHPDAYRADPISTKFREFICVGINTRPTLQAFNINNLNQQPLFNEVYDNFFRCIYNLPPNYGKEKSSDNNKHEYISKITDLLQAASYLDAIHAIRVNVEAHLLRMAQVLWLHIQKKPEGWVHIAGMLQSDIIFRECMVHLVGRYHLKTNGIDREYLTHKSHGELGAIIWEVIEKKAGELKDLKLYTERHLIEWFPPRMIHTDDNKIVPGRAIYTNDIYFWIALSLVRQYIMSAYIANFHHRASDGGLSFYRSIRAADGYLNQTTLTRFHVTFDMSSKGRQVLAEAVEDFKKDIRPLVDEILADHSQGSADGKEYDHFTCTQVSEDDLPWNILNLRKEQRAAEAMMGEDEDEDTEMEDED